MLYIKKRDSDFVYVPEPGNEAPLHCHLKTPLRRFRAVARKVIANRFWIKDVYEGPWISRTIKTVKILTQKKKALEQNDRQVLLKPASERTPEENAHLYRQIGGLKCFKKYPTQVKKKLAGCTYYIYYGPNRMLIRQGDPAYAMYFIIEGEVAVNLKFWDPLFKEWTTKQVGTLVEGDLFGEVALLNNIPRTASIVTMTDVQLLCIYKADFDRVLKDTIQEEWDAIKMSLKRFTYFDHLDQMSITEACIIAKIQAFEQNQTILGDGFGNQNFTYFILNGTCSIIDRLDVLVEKRRGVPHYKLLQEPDENAQLDSAVQSDLNMEKNHAKAKKGSKSKLRLGKDDNKSDIIASEKSVENEETEYSHTTVQDNKRVSSHNSSVKQKADAPLELPANYNTETYFVEICTLSELACFGVGECLKYKRVVTKTPVKCLLIPKYWIHQRNEGNVWNRTRNYLDNSIPNHREVFKRFINERKWLNYRKQLFNQVYYSKPSIRKTGTYIYDVPYSLRTSMLEVEFERKFTYELG